MVEKRVGNLKKPEIEFAPLTGFIDDSPKQEKRSLTAERRQQVGTKINMPLSGGRTVVMELRRIPAEQVEKATLVFGANERDQQLLTRESLGYILDTLDDQDDKEGYQRIPAISREVNGLLEVADGSSRRMSCILARKDFWSWVGDLNDSDMEDLSEVGNHHKQPSEWEKARRLMIKLETEFGGNKSQAEKALGISRRQLGRIEKIAQVPRELVRAYPSPNDMSGRQAVRLLEAWNKASKEQKEWAVKKSENGLWVPWDDECKLDKNEMITQTLEEILGIKPKTPAPVKTKDGEVIAQAVTPELSHKLTANHKKGTVNLRVKNAPVELLSHVEKAMSDVMANYWENGWHWGVEHDLTEEQFENAADNIDSVVKQLPELIEHEFSPEQVFAAKRQAFIAMANLSPTFNLCKQTMLDYLTEIIQPE